MWSSMIPFLDTCVCRIASSVFVYAVTVMQCVIHCVHHLPVEQSKIRTYVHMYVCTCKEYWHQMGLCMYVYVATQEWLQPQTELPQNSMYVCITWPQGKRWKTCTVIIYVRTWTYNYIYIQKRRLGNIRETQASILRKYMEPVEPGPYWHMRRFRSVSSRDRGCSHTSVCTSGGGWYLFFCALHSCNEISNEYVHS